MDIDFRPEVVLVKKVHGIWDRYRTKWRVHLQSIDEIYLHALFQAKINTKLIRPIDKLIMGEKVESLEEWRQWKIHQWRIHDPTSVKTNIALRSL